MAARRSSPGPTRRPGRPKCAPYIATIAAAAGAVYWTREDDRVMKVYVHRDGETRELASYPSEHNSALAMIVDDSGVYVAIYYGGQYIDRADARIDLIREGQVPEPIADVSPTLVTPLVSDAGNIYAIGYPNIVAVEKPQ
jgi:hypothetical protein